MNLKTIIVLVLSLSGALTAQIKDNYLNALVKEAIAVSPRISELQSQAKIASDNINVGTNLPDPIVTFGLANLPTNSFSFTQEAMTGKFVSLTQAIPFPGKLKTFAKAKSVDTLIVNKEIENIRNKITFEISKLYFNLVLVREKIALINNSKLLLRKINDIVTQKYKVGKAGLQNIVQSRVEITRLDDKLIALKKNEKSLTLRINVLLHRNTNTNIETIKKLHDNLTKVNEEKTLTLLGKENPELRIAKLNIKKGKYLAEKIRYELLPNFKFRVQYTQRDYSSATGKDLNDLVSFFVGISIPINYGGNKSSMINSAAEKIQLYNHKYTSELEKLSGKTLQLVTKADEFVERVELISNKLLPQTNEAFKAAQSDYIVNKIDFVNVLNAENRILMTEISLAETKAEYYKTISELNYLVGTDITTNFETEK